MEEQARQLRAGLEDQVHALRQDLEKRDSHIQELTSSLADLREHIAEMEANGQATARRIGQNLYVLNEIKREIVTILCATSNFSACRVLLFT